MLDLVIEKAIHKIGEQFLGRPRRLKGPKLRVRRNGSVEITVKDLLNSEAGRAEFDKVHSSPSTQKWLKEHGFDASPIEWDKLDKGR